MRSKLYNIICKNCHAERQVGIDNDTELLDWLGDNPNPNQVKIISARKRFDGLWGWQCICGNDDLWTSQEIKSVSDLTNPKPKEITEIIKDLKVQKPKFEMVAI